MEMGRRRGRGREEEERKKEENRTEEEYSIIYNNKNNINLTPAQNITPYSSKPEHTLITSTHLNHPLR